MRTTKRIFSAILVAAMLVSTVITTAFAEGNFTVKASEATAKAGETVDVTVSLANNPGIIVLRLQVGYNSDVLTLTNVKDGAIIGAESHSDELSDNPYILYWVNGETSANYTADGTAATLTFKVSDNAQAGEYPVTVTVLDSAATEVVDIATGEQGIKNVTCAAESGKVTVEEDTPPSILYGDVNGDGKVNPMDRTFLARHIANWAGYGVDDINYAAADVNGDGKVNPMDRTILARHIANWAGYDVLPFKN